MLAFLAKKGIPRFDYNQVDRYLAAIAEKDGKVWIWRPLREKDKLGWERHGRHSMLPGHHHSRGHGSCRSEWEYRPYQRAIPIRILRQVNEIKAEFGDKIKFLVSDFKEAESPNFRDFPDPFISVVALDMEVIVFGVWDEPGFSDE